MTIDELCRSFAKIVEDQNPRRERAARDGERMRAELERGIEPGGYRAAWMRETALKLVTTLGEQCLEFNEAFPGDVATGEDCVNAVVTTLNLLLNKAGRKLEIDGTTMRIVPL